MPLVIVGGTGHRPERLDICHAGVLKETEQWIAARPDAARFNVGGARGFDTMLGLLAASAGREVVLYLPFPTDIFTRYWTKEDRRRLYLLISYAREVKIFQTHYSAHGYILRDRAIVDDADQLLAAWDGQRTGGTWETIAWAQHRQKPVHRIWPGSSGQLPCVTG